MACAGRRHKIVFILLGLLVAGGIASLPFVYPVKAVSYTHLVVVVVSMVRLLDGWHPAGKDSTTEGAGQ